MAWPFRREQQTSRSYPAAGTSVTGSARRFLRSKTAGARAAGQAAEDWERCDRDNERRRRGPWAP